MESIKPDSSPPDETLILQFFNKINKKDVFQIPNNLDTIEFNSQKNQYDDRPWIIDGLAFPAGTLFRGKYKGYFYCGKVSEGALVLNGRKFLSPSAAALAITRSAVDGWLFWNCKPPGMSSWINIYTLRYMKQQKSYK